MLDQFAFRRFPRADDNAARIQEDLAERPIEDRIAVDLGVDELGLEPLPNPVLQRLPDPVILRLAVLRAGIEQFLEQRQGRPHLRLNFSGSSRPLHRPEA